MYKQLKAYGRLSELLFLGSLSGICFVLSVFRYIYTDIGSWFLFLNWNLFLAFIPLLLSTILTVYPKLQKNIILLTLILFPWLLFFPNSFYILTDLYHLQSRTPMPKWFDLLMILSYAWTGLIFGFMSLWDIEKILSQRIKRNLMPFVSLSLLFLASFGVYIGRYLRWNSWDIIKEPFDLFYDVSVRVLNPHQHKGFWVMTLLMFLFLNMVYWSFRFIKSRSSLL